MYVSTPDFEVLLYKHMWDVLKLHIHDTSKCVSLSRILNDWASLNQGPKLEFVARVSAFFAGMHVHVDPKVGSIHAPCSMLHAPQPQRLL
jgi:hypothetical protein